jgi:uncharacterized repeat protein (TIGR02543 family)
VFSGLSSDTSYTFYQRYKAKTGYSASPKSAGLTVRTNIASQNAPAAPTLASKSTNSVTLKTLSGAEYSRGGSTWQSSSAFSGLSSDTSYTFYQRYKAKAGYSVSPKSSGLTIKTNKPASANPVPKPTPTPKPKPNPNPTPKPTAASKYNISYSPNWGSLKIAKSYKSKWAGYFSPKPSVTTVTYGKTYGTLPSIKNQPKGYRFAGWYTSALGGAKVTSGSKVDITKTTTLFARWTAKKYKVKFNAGSKSLNKKVTYGKRYGKLPKAKDKTGQLKFLGWYTKKKGGKKITPKSIVKITKTKTLYAHWKRR